MKRIVALTLALCAITYAAQPQQVVGCFNTELQQGWNEIKVNFEALGEEAIFTTLDRIGHFSPPEAVIGDELVFDLDGFHQKYRFASFNATNSTYSLVLAMNTTVLPPQISFDWIPLPRVFWINHTSTNSACFTSSGKISLISQGKLESAKNDGIVTTHESELLIVNPVSTTDAHLIYTFKGGRIENLK